jgi:hypothetical protein
VAVLELEGAIVKVLLVGGDGKDLDQEAAVRDDLSERSRAMARRSAGEAGV